VLQVFYLMLGNLNVLRSFNILPLRLPVIPAQAGIQVFDFVWFLVLKAVHKK
jgi:hypothetical protein